MTSVKIVPTDAVASPVVVDITGPAADADAIVRFLASPSFDAALSEVAKAATEAEKKRIATLVAAHFEATNDEMVNGMISGALPTGESVRHHTGRMFALDRLHRALTGVSFK